ncbi:MAG TPA: type II CAAX endopeptidase family protein [Silvibacterium sp.]|nr:type II CAAX endopeptidase family protein [Silvibacterium sp.]
MKISEKNIEGLSGPVQADLQAWPVPAQPVAPWWHTAVVIAVILGVSALGIMQAKSASFGKHHLRQYTVTMAWEIVLAALVWWGIKMRRVPMRQLLGERRTGARAWLLDFGVALIFWLMAVIVLAAIAAVLRVLHLIQVQKAVIALAPRNGWEAVLWIALSITAGIVEELVFRGYLLQQFASIREKLWIGALASSLLFGAAHGYEGLGSMIAITAYGAMFCALTIQRKSLRPGMIAHAWHDSVTGIALALVKHLHAI